MYLTLSAYADPTPNTCVSAKTAPDRTGHKLYRRLTPGQHLFFEGDDAEHLYEVKRGMVRLARVLENGRRQIVAFGLPGDIVGFPEGGCYHTDCDAISDAVVEAHRRSALEDGETDHALHQKLTGAALQEICAMQDHFMMLSSKSANEKVAAFLLTMVDRIGERTEKGVVFDLPMMRVDIADFLGLTTETVCRAFTRFRRDKLISLDTPQRVLVLDPQGLRDRAEPE